MPIISKKRLNLGISVYHGGPDIAMLFLAMRLMISSPQGDQAEPLYRLCKSFLASLEAAGCASYQYLQALLLVAIYEHSHGIYPAAWMTVGTCARYAEFLGLSCSASRGIELRPVVSPIFADVPANVMLLTNVLDNMDGGRRKEKDVVGSVYSRPLHLCRQPKEVLPRRATAGWAVPSE